MLVMIKGAGDIASGIAMRLWRAGINVVMTDLPRPSSIRRTVCFSEAVYRGETMIEEVRARHAENAADALRLLEENILPVIVDPKAESAKELHPDVIVDAILAKENLGTAITDAPGVVGVGPGFTAGVDCHAVVETMRGHTLGRVIWSGGAIPNTGVPGEIGGYTVERVMHSPCGGVFHALRQIGDTVEAGETVATVGGEPLYAKITGTLRGILPEGFEVPREHFKSADVDPRCRLFHCFTVSDKALSVGGGVLEAVLMLTSAVGTARKSERRGEDYGK